MDSDKFDISSIHKGREVIYAFFSDLFLYPPSDEFYCKIATLMGVFKGISENSANESMMLGINALEKFVSKRNVLVNKEKDEPQALMDFNNDGLRVYTRLFCLSDSVPVSESVYLSPVHLFAQEEEGKVATLYDSNGFAMNCSSNEPFDHISYELMFMAFLACEISKAIDIDDNVQALKLLNVSLDFGENHLNKWSDEFYNSLSGFSESSDMYLPAASFIKGYIQEDIKFINETLQTIDLS